MERAQTPFCSTKRLAILLSFVVAVVFLFLAFRPPPPLHEGPRFKDKPSPTDQDKPNAGRHGGHGGGGKHRPPKAQQEPTSPPENNDANSSPPPIPDTPPPDLSKPLSEVNLSPLASAHKQRVKDYCKLLTNPDITGPLFAQTQKVDSVNGNPVYAYKNGDIVSDRLIRFKKWEQDEFASILSKTEKYTEKKGLKREDVYFVDIGANLGVYSLGFAHKGFSVIAFEAGIVNNVLINRVLCDVPEYQDFVTLFDFGLGKEEAVCAFFSDDGNKGDGHLECTKTKDFVPQKGYSVRDIVEIKRLDDVINDPEVLSRIGAVKMDTEGFEALIVAGGKNFFNSKIPYIFSEAEPSMVSGKGGSLLEYWTTLRDAGYWAECKKKGLTKIDPHAFVSAGLYDCFLIHESVKDL